MKEEKKTLFSGHPTVYHYWLLVVPGCPPCHLDFIPNQAAKGGGRNAGSNLGRRNPNKFITFRHDLSPAIYHKPSSHPLGSVGCQSRTTGVQVRTRSVVVFILANLNHFRPLAMRHDHRAPASRVESWKIWTECIIIDGWPLDLLAGPILPESSQLGIRCELCKIGGPRRDDTWCGVAARVISVKRA